MTTKKKINQTFLSFFSDSSRHCAHGEIVNAGFRIPGKGPKAIHGRLWWNPGHEQCQGKKYFSNRKTDFLRSLFFDKVFTRKLI